MTSIEDARPYGPYKTGTCQECKLKKQDLYVHSVGWYPDMYVCAKCLLRMEYG